MILRIRYSLRYSSIIGGLVTIYFIYQHSICTQLVCKDVRRFSSSHVAAFSSSDVIVSNARVEANATNQDRVLTESGLKSRLLGDCDADVVDLYVKLDLHPDVILHVDEYKDQLARNFTRNFSNPSFKINSPARLTSYENLPLPDASGRVNDTSEDINIKEIDDLLLNDKLYRLSLGDDDVLKIPEVIEELNNTKFKVPNIIHFIWFGKSSQFRVVDYMAIIGALRYQNPKVILFHVEEEPHGEYWEAAKNKAGSVLKIVKRTPPSQVYGNLVEIVEHQADVARLHVLMEVGGVYLDVDSIVLKSLDPLRDHEMVLGESYFSVLANGVILANKNAWFLRRWHHEYKYFQDNIWAQSSVLVPWGLSQLFPDEIYVAKEEICRPSYMELDLIFRNVFDFSKIYVLHLYSRMMKAKDGREERPLKQLAVLNTTYGQVARHVIWGDKKIRDVTDWIVACDLDRILNSK